MSPKQTRSTSRTGRARKLSLTLVIFLVGLVGCFPYHGRTQEKVPQYPRTFMHPYLTGDVLIIPRYSSFLGLSSGGGHGPGVSLSDKTFIAHPFIYKQGDKFAPKEGRTIGIIWGLAAFTGKGTTLDGVLVVAPGYKSQWIWDYWSEETPVLTPLSSRAAQDELQKLSAMLDKKVATGSEKEEFSFAASDPLYIHLTKRDKQMIRSFISKGIAKLAP